MTIRVAINHTSLYLYDRLVNLSPHVVRLRPAPHTRTPIKAYSLRIRPEKHFINWQQDPFGNYLARLVFQEKTKELFVEVDLIAEMTVINPFDFFIEEYAEKSPFKYEEQLRYELKPYLEIKEEGKLLKAWVAKHPPTGERTIDFMVKINQSLWQDISYTIRMEPGVQTCEETLTKALGSCRDSAWLLVQILRHYGLAARFVSGYLVQLKPDVVSLDGPAGPSEDFTDLHAWTEVYIPGAGWIGLDPTSGLFAGEGHIPLACTPDPSSAAAVSGFTDICEVSFSHHNNVQRIYEDTRVTKPYSEAQWAAVNTLGETVDKELEAYDVRLTMGGEPTFVSIDDMDSPEWNVSALGAHKRSLAGDLINRLRQRFSPGGVLHFGQGKWYPGEPLPRWALSCFWRQDGRPLWKNLSLLASEEQYYGFDINAAQKFSYELSRYLGLRETSVIPGYEDTFYYLWREGLIPENLDPLKANLEDPIERRNLADVLQQGLGVPTGFVLPVEWDYNNGQWRSSPWPLRRGHLFLIPGDSPMGYRLPLDSLPYIAEEQREILHERHPFATRPPLAEYQGEVSARYSHVVANTTSHGFVIEQPYADHQRQVINSTVSVVRTSICIQPRNGKLYVFLPPLYYLEHYTDLIASIEATAKTLSMPIVLEGYEPPNDWRLKSLKVTPDPGVIEVNIHPSTTWSELVEKTTILYEEARQARLGTEKFMLDGRHVGTGGGNHITIGGRTPADSPVLRRPDLLQSLITLWQHHPGLSFLFSGLFIGPTSQSPRVDEARHEHLYELEIAFEQMPSGMISEAWIVDRLLRNLLVDSTGNTHRAEFCIDKLYSPDSFSGRQGIVELRAFEMPPHPHMSLIQALLLRTLIARFWSKPYKGKLVRWGTELHDRFMLPHYVWADVKDVISMLNDDGYAFDPDWLLPFFEFRFPLVGITQIEGITIELRTAIEPWHVLGEEVTTAGTARFVDSSVERMQVKVKGLTDNRHVLVCNGRRIPLNSTGTHGEYIAGVRYRAWQPPSALHPRIGVHSPLIFDIIDTWNGRSVGGCRYYVSHPGGRSYDILPINSYEAEARRITRFWDYGHTPGILTPPPQFASTGKFFAQGHKPGPMAPPVEEPHPEYPYTLDLRRPVS